MDNAHDWHLSSINNEGTFYAIAICRHCGPTRSALIGRGNNQEKYIDLSGICGEPEPERQPLVERR